MDDVRGGVLALVLACTIWGLSPLFYKLLADVPTLEILAHRTLWSCLLFSGLLALQGRLAALGAVLGDRRAALITGFCALMISANWFLFILSVQIGRTTEASLGYYIYPLVAVLFGIVAFDERLGRAQWTAVGLATLAVTVMTVGQGVAPWISLVLAVTFGLYTVVKKRLGTGPVVSVTAEIALLLPLALCYLAWIHLGPQAQGGVFGRDALASALLITSGVLTALPLILFSRAAQRVRMTTVGLIQYVNPTLQFLCAVLVFAEPFGVLHAVTFALIWAALAIYTGALWRADRRSRKQAMVASGVAAQSTNAKSEASAKP